MTDVTTSSPLPRLPPKTSIKHEHDYDHPLPALPPTTTTTMPSSSSSSSSPGAIPNPPHTSAATDCPLDRPLAAFQNIQNYSHSQCGSPSNSSTHAHTQTPSPLGESSSKFDDTVSTLNVRRLSESPAANSSSSYTNNAENGIYEQAAPETQTQKQNQKLQQRDSYRPGSSGTFGKHIMNEQGSLLPSHSRRNDEEGVGAQKMEDDNGAVSGPGTGVVEDFGSKDGVDTRTTTAGVIGAEIDVEHATNRLDQPDTIDGVAHDARKDLERERERHTPNPPQVQEQQNQSKDEDLKVAQNTRPNGYLDAPKRPNDRTRTTSQAITTGMKMDLDKSIDIGAPRGSAGPDGFPAKMMYDNLKTPEINPFHALSFPDGNTPPLTFAIDETEPQLSPIDDQPRIIQATRMVNGIEHTWTTPGPKLEPSVHVTRVSKDTVELVPASDIASNSEGQPQGIKEKLFGKVGKAFSRNPSAGRVGLDGRNDDDNDNDNDSGHVHGNANVPDFRAALPDEDARTMEGALPPSPPISEHDDEDDSEPSSERTERPTASLSITGQQSLVEEPDAMSLVSEPESTATRQSTVPIGSVQDQKSKALLAGVAPVLLNVPVASGLHLTPTRSGSIAAIKKRTPSTSTAPQQPRSSSVSPSMPANEPFPAPPSTDASHEDNCQSTYAPSRPSFSSVSSSLQTSSKANRRNTFANSTTAISQSARIPLTHSMSHTHVQGISSEQKTEVPGLDGSALDSDILAEADRLRRERLSRRQKKKDSIGQDSVEPQVVPEGRALDDGSSLPAQASHERPMHVAAQRKLSEKEHEIAERVLVGNLIGEGHVNYVLMYNMLTGIRIGVSRCQAKVKRTLTQADYSARHKFSFDIVGNELTPSARYDFKFKDYAPWVFRELREDHFHLDPADYLLSLTAKYILSELGSPGKSGSFFYFSRDYRFIIKTIHHTEHKFLRSILKDYHAHIKANPHTLLSRFYGLHRVKLPRGRKIHFVIMNNLFPPHRDIHETYDLKGSAWGRETSEEKLKQNPKATLKDLNWLHRGRKFELGPEKRALLSEQLRRDMGFLKKLNVIDYSLLIGIHNMERGNRDNIRENQLSVFHPDVSNVAHRRKPSSIKVNSDASAVRKAIRRSDPKALVSASSELPTHDSADRRHFLFYQDEGGLRTTDESNQPMDTIYYLGVIDILTPYTNMKKLEHFWKSITEDRHMISCVPPEEYGQRFIRFLLSFMRGADISQRPKMDWPKDRHHHHHDETDKVKTE